MLQIEMKLRENANPDTIWLEQLPDDTTAAKAQCSQFRTQTYAQWLDGSSVSAPQWREAWHGVAVRADYKTRLSNWSQVKSINLIAAVKSPGIPASAFVNDKTGALRPVFFDTAALFKAAGFDRMRGVVGQLSMHLKEQKSCDGYELYTWQFSR